MKILTQFTKMFFATKAEKALDTFTIIARFEVKNGQKNFVIRGDQTRDLALQVAVCGCTCKATPQACVFPAFWCSAPW